MNNHYKFIYTIITIILIGFFCFVLIFNNNLTYLNELIILFNKMIDFGIDPEFWIILPDMFLLYLIMSFLWFFVINNNNKDINSHKIAGLACCVSLFINLMYITNLSNIVDIDTTYYMLNGMIEITPVILVTKWILLLVTILVLLVITFENRINYKINREMFLIILISLFGMFILIEANNLFLIYICMELQSIALYILSSMKPYSNKSIEAGLKYFIYGSFMSVVFVLGISFLYGLTGTLDLNDLVLFISISDNNEFVINFALICVLIVFLFKMALFPFNWWIDDVYAGSSDLVVFFFTIVPKLSIFMVFVKLYFFLFINFPLIKLIIFISSFLSVILATIWALWQVKFIKLLAFSSIAHFGLIVLSLVTGLHNGFIAAIYFIYIYIITTNFIFIAYLILRRIKRSEGISNIIDFTYFKEYNKTLNLIFIISLLSLAGIPPLAGFFGKLYFFHSLIINNEFWLFLILIILTIISCVYYIRLIRFLFFSDRDEDYIVPYKKIPDVLIYSLVILFLINLFFIFIQTPLLYIISNFIFYFYI